jgi:hypothetical protein
VWHAPVGQPRKKRESGLVKKKNGPAQGIVPFLIKSKFLINLNLKRSKGYTPELENFDENMVLKFLMRGTTFSIVTSPDSK